MSNQVYRIEDYKFSNSDEVLFDANVWLYIYGPTGNRYPRLRAKYTLALRQIRSVGGQIFLDGFVLSEFINAYARFVYNEWPLATKPEQFKSFRNSDEFKPVAKEIVTKSRRLLKKCQQTGSGFESINLDPIFSKYATGGADFNDMMLAELCQTKGLKLVTHDSDFKDDNLTIITANRKLLN
ncbi:MAG: PIN domain-containing protein [Hormoscilla sp. GM7CHS1pb]|nr:PIN domain-containing protein [Hormoscilla sp. GM7CHS1pb]